MKQLLNKNWLENIKYFLLIAGPNLLAAESNNDQGAVTAYMQAGGQYGYSMLWIMALLFPIIYICQEMSVRLGITTKEGFTTLIYRKFGKIWGNLSLFNLLTLNLLILMTEFAGITLVSKALNISPLITIPTSIAAFIWLVISKGYNKWEKIMVAFCLLDISWFLMAIFVHPSIASISKGMLAVIPQGGFSKDYLFLAMSVIGTSCTAWACFFLQSCVVEKRINIVNLKYAQFEAFLTSFTTVIVAFAMIIVGAVGFNHGIKFEDPAQLANAISPYFPWLKNLIFVMMINASLLGAVMISLSSAWAFAESQGKIHNLNETIKDAPVFYGIYFTCVTAAGAVCLIPNIPLELIILGVQVLSCISLPYTLVFLHILLNDKELVGEQYVNKPWQNFVNATIIAVLCGLSILLFLQVIFPHLFK